MERNVFVPAQAAEGFHSLADDRIDVEICKFQVRSLIIEVVESQQSFCELGQTVCF